MKIKCIVMMIVFAVFSAIPVVYAETDSCVAYLQQNKYDDAIRECTRRSMAR
jgi:preprotein translocase subunit SecY